MIVGAILSRQIPSVNLNSNPSMKTKLEIIQETQDAYADPRHRAVKLSQNGFEDGCVYLDSRNGNMCALGRCMLDPSPTCGLYASGLADEKGSLDAVLKKEYRGHAVQFWVELQRFHDNAMNFEDGGLSVNGLGYLSELRTKWEGK
jgi:hypothetical protein